MVPSQKSSLSCLLALSQSFHDALGSTPVGILVKPSYTRITAENDVDESHWIQFLILSKRKGLL